MFLKYSILLHQKGRKELESNTSLGERGLRLKKKTPTLLR